MSRVIWSEGALDELDAIVAYLEIFNPAAAERIHGELTALGNSLNIFPNRGRLGRVAGTRELVTVPPYVLIYEVVNGASHILRVRHSARQPLDG